MWDDRSFSSQSFDGRSWFKLSEAPLFDFSGNRSIYACLKINNVTAYFPGEAVSFLKTEAGKTFVFSVNRRVSPRQKVLQKPPVKNLAKPLGLFQSATQGSFHSKTRQLEFSVTREQKDYDVFALTQNQCSTTKQKIEQCFVAPFRNDDVVTIFEDCIVFSKTTPIEVTVILVKL